MADIDINAWYEKYYEDQKKFYKKIEPIAKKHDVSVDSWVKAIDLINGYDEDNNFDSDNEFSVSEIAVIIEESGEESAIDFIVNNAPELSLKNY